MLILIVYGISNYKTHTSVWVFFILGGDMENTASAITLKPCDCGGIPYIHSYFAPKDVYEEDEWFTIRCQECGAIVSLDYTEDNAIIKWNEAM